MNAIKLKCAALEAEVPLMRTTIQNGIMKNENTFYNKLHQRSAFTLPEVVKISRLLKLSKDQIIEIFFDELLAEWSSNDNSINQKS